MNLKQIRASVTYEATYKHAQALGLTKDARAKMLQEAGLLAPSYGSIGGATTWPADNVSFFYAIYKLQSGDTISQVHKLFHKRLDTYKLKGVSYPVSQKLSQAAWAKEYRNDNKF